MMDPLESLALLCLCLIGTRLVGRLIGAGGAGATLLELCAGVLLGWVVSPAEVGSLLGASELGILVLFFLVGQEVKVDSMLGHRRAVLLVLCLNLALMGLLGCGLHRFLGMSSMEAATLCAVMLTSGTGLVMRVLELESQLGTETGRMLLTVSLAVDLVALACFAIVSHQGGASTIGPEGVNLPDGIALMVLMGGGFLVLWKKGPKTVDSWWVIPLLAVSAWATKQWGLTSLLGALAVGMWFQGRHRESLAGYLRPISQFLTPIYIITVGLSVPRQALSDPMAWGLGGTLAFMGVLISFLGARILRDFHLEERADLQVIAWGMIPRGLPGVVLARLAMSSGMVGPTTYLALVLMVALTNLIGLAGLTWRVRHPAQKIFSA